MPQKEPLTDDQVAQVAELIAGAVARGRGRRSPLYQWLMTHQHAFASMLSARTPSWDAIANRLGALGLTDGSGNAPTAERVRKTWWLVRHQAGQAEAPSPAPNNTDRPLRNELSGARTSADLGPAREKPIDTAEFDPDAIAPDAGTGPEFRPARPLNWTQSGGSLPPQKPSSRPHAGSGGHDYVAVLQQLMERASARALPMPQVPTAEET